MAASLEALAGFGFDGAPLWVFDGNTRACSGFALREARWRLRLP